MHMVPRIKKYRESQNNCHPDRKSYPGSGLLFNYYFDQNMDLLSDKNYYSPDYKLLDFIDVTDNVKF